ncbi:TonB-dependent receptor plug domain-containing protein [Pseudohongiella spirulinae]|uniref:Uncharacterized protein n=1 Tax=Pseudohongiella spirulinae TaxID=1249552 RepID=A0A0S2KB53_9GAMM|nr:TonB-dependent receptor [Pseudohongiella spirulinae]ALO45549.1 hypothetical protein PS2015_878 [Pseudohongiella spirulinae]
MIAAWTSRHTLLTLLSLSVPEALLHAQEPGQINSPDQTFTSADGSTVIYPAAFFAPYSPVSVTDMLDRIPGVSVGGGGGGRGLGTGGDLLINGQRIAGKDNSPREQLDRIAAREVERIEIIRGTSAELDVRGSGQVVNVVLTESDSRSSTQIELVGRLNHDDTAEAGASLSHSRQIGGLQALFNLESRPNYENRQYNETQYDALRNQIGTLSETNIRDQDIYEFSGNMSYRIGEQSMQFNVLFSDFSHPRYISRQFDDRLEDEDTDYDFENWEVGGDYGIAFENGHRAQLLFVATDQSRDYIRERFDVDAADNRNKSLYTESNQRTRERIVQGNYNMPLTDAQDIRLGLERAVTRLDSSLFIGSRSTDEPVSDRYGGLSPRPLLSNPGTTVEETRYEAFVFHNWTLNDRMTLESSLLYENSEIAQSGNVTNSRRFDFLRPSLDYRFNFTDSMQLRATVSKGVSQLSFSAFAATANNNDREQNANAGNPELEPQEETRFEVGLEYRLPADSGVVNSRIFFRDIKNYIGKINATTNPAQPLSAEGNVGPATRWGIFNDASLRLGFVGLPDAIVSAELNIFDSEITNPFLGSKERINRRGEAELGFRHDVTALRLSYGFDYRYPFHGGEYDIDIRTITRNDRQPSLNLFVSKVFFDDLTVRLESDNTLDDYECRQRQRFEPTTVNGFLDRIEESCSSRFRRLTLRVQSTF